MAVDMMQVVIDTPTLWSAAIAIVFTLVRGAWRLR
jgi:hypothetical protein